MESLSSVTSSGGAWTKSTIDHQPDNWHFSTAGISNNSIISKSQQLWRNSQPQTSSNNDLSTISVCGVVNQTELHTSDTSGIWQGLNMGAKDWDMNVHSALQGVGQWGSVGASSSLWGISEPLTHSLDTNAAKSVQCGSVESSGGSSTKDSGTLSQSVLIGGLQHKETDSDNNSQWSNPVNNNPSTDDVSTVSPLIQPTKEELLLRIKDEEFNCLLNNNAGWGQRRIDQSTPWEVGEARENRKLIDTMIWNHEPNNGTGIWETFYEQQGALPAHWRIQNSRDSSDNRTGNSEWVDDQWNSSGGGHGWKDSVDAGQFNSAGVSRKPRGSSSSWGDDSRGVTGHWVGNDSDWTNKPSTPVTPLTPGGGPSSANQWCDRQDDTANGGWKGGVWDSGNGSGGPSSWADKKDWNNDPLRRPTVNAGRTSRPPEMRSQA